MVTFLLLLLDLVASRKFSVSGVSSGAAMAVQMHVAYSASVEGAGIIAGQPYHCSQGSLLGTTACMTTPLLLNLRSTIQYTKDQSLAGTIDDVSHLSNSPAWVFSGLLDTVVLQLVGRDLAKYYEAFDVSVTTKFDVPAEHAWITDDTGNLCSVLLEPFINDCNLDAAGMILKNTYGSDLVKDVAKTENLITFDQRPYIEKGSEMTDQGFIYVPDGCKKNPDGCKVHVAFHGCLMNHLLIGDRFATGSGLNDWAEGSNIIVIYPQVGANVVFNPEGCWDWWGYTRSDYALKSGMQMKAVYEMVQKLPPFN